MNLKKTLALMLAMILALTVFVGCAPKENDENNSSEVSSETSPNEESSEEVSSEETPSKYAEPEVTATIADVHAAVKEHLGENYLPSMQMDEAMVGEVLKLTPDMYTEIIAEMPMISGSR